MIMLNVYVFSLWDNTHSKGCLFSFCTRFEPPKNIERLTLLKSVHIFKKHRVQYEMRTHYRCIEVRQTVFFHP